MPVRVAEKVVRGVTLEQLGDAQLRTCSRALMLGLGSLVAAVLIIVVFVVLRG